MFTTFSKRSLCVNVLSGFCWSTKSWIDTNIKSLILVHNWPLDTPHFTQKFFQLIAHQSISCRSEHGVAQINQLKTCLSWCHFAGIQFQKSCFLYSRSGRYSNGFVGTCHHAWYLFTISIWNIKKASLSTFIRCSTVQISSNYKSTILLIETSTTRLRLRFLP